jgi:long-subunit fatty acid transport protein
MASPPRLLPALALAGALGLCAAAAHASPEDIFGFGPRSSALGATGAASAEGYEAVYGNPALLSLARSRQLAVGFSSAIFDLQAKTHLSYDPLHGSTIGAVLPLPFGGVLKDRIAIGLGFFSPFDLVVRGRILYPDIPQYPLADRAQSVAVQAGIGVDLGGLVPGLRIGGGFAALAALTGTVLVATDATGRIGTTVDDTLVASYGPIAGVSYDIDDTWRLGVTFRGVLVGNFNVVITVQDLGSLVVPPLNISGVAQYDPWQIALELARVRGPWKVAVGLTYKRWSIYPGLAEATVRCPTVDPMTGLPFTGDCTATAPPPPGYHDILVPHFGAERTFAAGLGMDVHLRGGFFFEPSPAPAQSQLSNLYDNDRAVFTLGYGVEVGPPSTRLALDLFGQAQALIPRQNIKDGGVPSSNPGAPGTTVSGVIGAFGTTAGVRF